MVCLSHGTNARPPRAAGAPSIFSTSADHFLPPEAASSAMTTPCLPVAASPPSVLPCVTMTSPESNAAP